MINLKKPLFLLVMLLLPLFASADAVEIDGIYYNLVSEEKTAEVTRNSNYYSGSIIIPEKVKHEGTEYTVTRIGEHTFYACKLTSITIPNSVTSIGRWAFAWCGDLTSITISNNVTSIEDNTFYHCGGLTSITIPNSVTSIGESAFLRCDNLTSITIPNSVTSIGEWAFAGCSGLTSLTIGSGINNIGSQAFFSCPELADVYCYAEAVPSTNTDALDSNIEHATLHVPSSSLSAYKATEPWKKFKEIVALTDSDPKPAGIMAIEKSNNNNVIIYDLNGRRVEQPSDGLYIKNGKKYVFQRGQIPM